MPHLKRRACRQSAHMSAIVIPLAALLVAGCGGSGGSAGGPTTAARTTVARTSSSIAKTTTRPSTSSSTTSSRPHRAHPSALAFSRCMRANGVSDYPDPQPGGLQANVSGAVRSSPAFRTAQARCQRLMPANGILSSSGDSAQQRAQALAQLRTVAECMRRHGVPNFPDPTPTAPRNATLGGKYSEITNYMGVFLLFPVTLSTQSPAYNQAAAACGPLAESFTHAHH